MKPESLSPPWQEPTSSRHCVTCPFLQPSGEPFPFTKLYEYSWRPLRCVLFYGLYLQLLSDMEVISSIRSLRKPHAVVMRFPHGMETRISYFESEISLWR